MNVGVKCKTSCKKDIGALAHSLWLLTHQIGALRRVSRLIKARLLFGSDSSPMFCNVTEPGNIGP